MFENPVAFGKLKRAAIQANGLSLFYKDTGTGAESIICLHGYKGRGENWVELIGRYGIDIGT